MVIWGIAPAANAGGFKEFLSQAGQELTKDQTQQQPAPYQPKPHRPLNTPTVRMLPPPEKGPTAPLESQELAAQEKVTPLCYQDMCLKDPIRNLNYPVVGKTSMPNPAIVTSKRKAAAKKVLIGSDDDVSTLVKAGFADGSPDFVSQTTLDALRRIETLCGKPADFAKVKVKARNGKDVTLIYTPMTFDDGTSSYGLTALLVPYPEVQTKTEQKELIAQASAKMNVKLRCSSVGTEESCADESGTQTFSAEIGSITIQTSNRLSHDAFFNLDEARRDSRCSAGIKF